MNLIIVDDNEMFREFLRDFLTNKLQHLVIAEATSGEEFLKLENIHDADIILMDIDMQLVNGLVATKKILYLHSKLKVIAITLLIEEIFLEQLLEIGFKGCVFKTDIFEKLQTALYEVNHDRLFYPENIKIDNFN